MNYQEFFSALIHLLYSVSKSDKEVHLLEVQEILDIINSDIPKIFPEIPKEFQSLNNHLAIDEFKRLYKNQITEEQAYNYFIKFHENNKSRFNLDINLICYQLATKVAFSHKGVNEEEKQFLLKLKHYLKID
ncbi:MAG: hypothetical protein J7K39_06050 [Bacteroidales bacterium]|nr:hypothetical protein [Bacteroidales bacterium]